VNLREPPFAPGEYVEWIVPGLLAPNRYRGMVWKISRAPPSLSIKTGVLWLVEVACDDSERREVAAEELRRMNAVDSIARLA
jgi:hypothetical protein